MSLIRPEKQEVTVLHLKDVFLILSEVSKPIFAFKWTDSVGIYSR